MVALTPRSAPGRGGKEKCPSRVTTSGQKSGQWGPRVRDHIFANSVRHKCSVTVLDFGVRRDEHLISFALTTGVLLRLERN